MNNKIISLYIEILSQCNERCTYCYNQNNINNTVLLDIKSYKKLLMDAQQLGVRSVSISGGEPFLHKYLKDFIHITKSLNLPLTIITNLTLYDLELYRAICDNDISLQVTIDGPNEKVHDYTRGKGTFNKIISNIHTLNKMGYAGNLNIRMNLHKKNYIYVDDMFTLLQRINATFINFALINPVGGGKTFTESISNYDEFILSEIQSSVESNSKDHKNIRVLFEGLKESIGCPYYGKENIQCGLRVAPNGEVFPCQLFTEQIFSLGNINEKSIVDIINGEEMNDFLTLMQLRKKFIPECYQCAYKSICSTGCPAEAFITNGNIFSLNEKCFRNKKLFKDFFGNILCNSITNH